MPQIGGYSQFLFRNVAKWFCSDLKQFIVVSQVIKNTISSGKHPLPLGLKQIWIYPPPSCPIARLLQLGRINAKWVVCTTRKKQQALTLLCTGINQPFNAELMKLKVFSIITRDSLPSYKNYSNHSLTPPPPRPQFGPNTSDNLSLMKFLTC